MDNPHGYYRSRPEGKFNFTEIWTQSSYPINGIHDIISHADRVTSSHAEQWNMFAIMVKGFANRRKVPSNFCSLCARFTDSMNSTLLRGSFHASSVLWSKTSSPVSYLLLLQHPLVCLFSYVTDELSMSSLNRSSYGIFCRDPLFFSDCTRLCDQCTYSNFISKRLQLRLPVLHSNFTAMTIQQICPL